MAEIERRFVNERRTDPTGPGRNLSYIPCEVRDGIALRADEIDRYNRQGFLEPRQILRADEAADLREYFDDLLAQVLAAPDRRNSYSINTYHVVCERLHDLVTDPRITALATDLLGEEIVCWGSHLFAKLPHDGKEVPFHQDAVYWPMTPSRSVSVWLAIDDVDDENAAMRFVPGSHLDGALHHHLRDLDGTRVLAQEVDARELEDRSSYVNAMPAGYASLHSDMLLHGSAANASDRRRAGLTLRYVGAEVRLIEGYDYWRKSAVHVAGGDPSGFWYDRRRPDGEHPEKMAKLWGEFDGQNMDD
ncbi:MAG: phytanoyl-CoA dioxygenase family protein [Actinomycetota bacterium]